MKNYIRVRKVQKLTGTGGQSVFITIPKDFVNILKIERGDYVKILLEGNKIIIEKLSDF